MKSLFIVNILSLILGYYREIFILNEFGTSILTDTYVLINRIVIGINLELYIMFTAFFILNLASKNNRYAYGSFQKFILLVSFLQTFLLLVNIYYLDRLNIDTILSSILLAILPFFTIAISYYRSIYELKVKKYLYGTLLKPLTSLFIIICILLYKDYLSIFLIVCSIFLAYLAMYIWGRVFIDKSSNSKSIKLSLIDIFNEPKLNTLIKFALISQVIILIDIFILSFLGEGALSNFHYSSMFYVLLLFFYTSIIITYYFPKLVNLFNKYDLYKIRIKVNKIILISVIIYIPILLLAYLFIDDVLLIIFNEKVDIDAMVKTIYLLFILVIPSIFKEIIKTYFRVINRDNINVSIQYIYMYIKIIIVIPLTYIYGWDGFIISFILVNIIVPLVYIYKYIDIQWQE